MRIIACRRDPAGRVRDLVETVQSVERAMCHVAGLVGCRDHVAHGVVGKDRGLARCADVLKHISECVERIRMLARNRVRGVQYVRCRAIAKRIECV